MPEAKKILTRLLSSADLDKLDDQRPDLDRAYKVLAGKLSPYGNIWNYYDGDQPLMYTAKRMRELFDDLDMATFVENWCAVVIDSANDRINLSGITTKDATASKLLEDIWSELDLGLEASDVHEAALVIGESYIIVGEHEEEKVQVYYNDPRLVHLFYQPGNPKEKWYGAKWWVGGDNHIRMTLYYDDYFEYYRSSKKADNVTSSKAFVLHNPTDEEGGDMPAHEYGQVPIFHYRLERRKVKGDLVNAIPIQNAINKLVTDLMVAAEFGAFKQRYIVSNADTAALKNAPNEIWEIPADDGEGGSVQVGEFDATDLNNYIQSIDHLASAVAIITRTPKHYLFQQGGTPSGEALIAMEAPLNKRCKDHIDKFTPVWKEVAQFILKILGTDVDKKDILVNFDKPETVQPKTEAEIRTHGKNVGIPLKTLLRDEGKDEAWIKQMEKDKKEEQEAAKASLGAALMAGVRNANQPPEGEEEEGNESE